MKVLSVAFVAALCACSGEGSDGGGDDTLPKRGERADDPTIVAATAGCEFTVSQLKVSVSASDSMGVENLASCVVATAEHGDVSADFDGTASTCVVYFPGGSCTPGTSYKLDLTVSNKTSGVTTASVTVSAN